VKEISTVICYDKKPWHLSSLSFVDTQLLKEELAFGLNNDSRAIIAGSAGDAFLGTQGDVFDTAKGHGYGAGRRHSVDAAVV
jgi:uncharacterized membrane protein YjdF